MSEEKINSSNQPDTSSWEAQLQARANELVNHRVGALKAEIERLQTTIAELGSKLSEQTQPVVTPEESSGLLDYVRQLFSDANAKAEQGVEKRLADARAEWETTYQAANEAEFQKRLETACAEAAAIARREAESQIEDLREQLDASRKALTLAVSASQSAASQASSLDGLKAAVEEIDSQRTQSDTLATLVRRASQFSPRIVFFVVKGNEAVGWKASGFDNGLNDETVRLLSVSTQNQTLLREALTTFNVAKARSSSPGENSAVLGLYGAPAPETALAIPLVVRGKAAAVLYADSGTQSENDIATSALETLVRVASMGIELLPSRRGVEPARPSGPPPQLSATAAQASAVAAALAPEPVVAPPSPQPVAPPPPPVEVPAPVAEAEVAAELAEPKRITEELPPPEFTPQLSSAAEPEVSLHSAKTQPAIEIAEEAPKPESTEPVTPAPSFEAPRLEPIVPPPPPPAPPLYVNSPAQPDYSLPVAAEAPKFEPPTIEPPVFTSPVIEAPRPAQPVMAIPTAASETEQRAHNDARRFARLLVSEIKLYNAAKVTEGRRSLDLYDRLRDEIDRSRKVYDKRVSPAVATRFDYFYDELVQTLAEGDDAKLGPNCPGPVVS